MLRPTYAEIDLSAIRHNIKAIRARVGSKVKIMPAVKANGYGHGAVEVSRAVLQAGAEALSVATPEEGIELREAGFDVPILILGCSTPDAAADIVRCDLASTVCDLTYARALSEAAVNRANRPKRGSSQRPHTASVHVKVDTGMGRIGVRPDQALDFIRELRSLPGISVDGVFTHFPSADEPDRSFTLSQIATFSKVLDALKRHGTSVPLAHASNSGGVLGYPQADYDAVRPGIMIYGSYPSLLVVRSISVRQAMTLKTRIVFLKDVDAGTTVSYGRTHTLKRRSKVATLPIGYADGYQRALSNRGEAAVRGVRVPVIGRVCMDQIMIDVTDVPGVQTGDEVILMGGGYDYLSANNVATKAGTIAEETYCAVSSRVPRVYINA
jgi:alanine racemase